MATQNIEVVQDNKYYTACRLPTDLAPENYNLTLKPDLKEFKFDGHVDIEFSQTDNKVSEIILNASNLDIKGGHVTAVDGTKINLKKCIYNDDLGTVAMKFDKDNFTPKILFLEFSGILNDKMKGFYRSSFEIDNQTVFAATTQFEACDARQAFPCFDEPAIKATFDVTVVYDSTPIAIGDKSYKPIALSNGNLISETPSDNGKTIAKFEKSPKMSTYLLAFIVGPFNYVESKSSNGCRVRVYATPGKENQGEFALDVACKSLDYYEKYFDIKFPLNKMDLIAIPDFNSGAMENWGLVTYRETCLLFDPKTTSTASKQFIAIVVAHELAHQWFGNLVTMNWWNDLWLNEGFASFMEFLCTDSIFPEWDLWSQFINDMWSQAMDLDSLHSSHPIEVPVNFASEIDEIFDNISYQKGCSVIRMLYEYIGDDMFRVGMKNYLEKFSYKNAETKDLWDCLEEASGKPIAKMMSAWTGQMGYPWIKVEVANQESPNDLALTLEQEKFTSNGKLHDGEEKLKWMVPISIASGSKDVELISEFLEDRSKTFVIPRQGNNWLKLNKDTIGFYRVAYPQILLDRLIEIIQEDFTKKGLDANFKESLSPMDRLGIQNDYFALCRAGHVATSDLLNLLGCYEDETNYTVWRSIDNCIYWLSIIFRDTQYSEPFCAFGRRLYGKIYNKLTWDAKSDECHTDSMLRAMVINRLVQFEHQDVINISQKLFNSQIKEGKPIKADLRQAVYTAISKFGPDQDYEELFKLRKQETSHEEKNRIVRALAFTKQPDRLKRAIDLIFTDEVRIQDKVSAIVPIAMTNPTTCWNLFKEKHVYFKQIYGSGHTMSALVKYSTEFFTTKDRAQEIEKFFEINKFPGAERSIQQALETIRLNTEWLGRLGCDIQVMKFLGKYL